MTNPDYDPNYKKDDYRRDNDNSGLWIGGLVAVVLLIGVVYFTSARTTSDYNYSAGAPSATTNPAPTQNPAPTP